MTIKSLHDSIKLPKDWFDHTDISSLACIKLCKFCSESDSAQPLVAKTVLISNDFSWKVFIHDREVKNCSVLSNIPHHVDKESVRKLINVVHEVGVCAGHPDSKFVEFILTRKEKLFSKSGEVAAT